MSEDEVEYQAAEAVMREMASFNQRCLWFPTLPYRVGIVVAVAASPYPALRLADRRIDLCRLLLDPHDLRHQHGRLVQRGLRH